jgi:hypothetical protein
VYGATPLFMGVTHVPKKLGENVWVPDSSRFEDFSYKELLSANDKAFGGLLRCLV